MNKTDLGFDLLGKWPNVGGQAEWGKAADWSMRGDLTKYPALVFSDTGGGQDCEITSVDIVEMTPTRPIIRAANVNIAVSYEPSGATLQSRAIHERGTITRGVEENSFVIVYRGTRNFKTSVTSFDNTPGALDADLEEKTSC